MRRGRKINNDEKRMRMDIGQNIRAAMREWYPDFDEIFEDL